MLYAQAIPLIHYTTEQGLPSNVVYSVFTDSKGYLWICTDKGLCRYNGSSFKQLTTRDGLPSNDVFSCREDPQGRQWIATYKGTLCYLQDGIMHTAANTPWLRLPPEAGLFFSHLNIQNDGSLIFLSNSGDHFVEIKDTMLRLFSTPRSLLPPNAKDRFAGVRKVNANHYYLYTPGWRLSVDTFMHIRETKSTQPLVGHWPDSIFLANDTAIYDWNNRLLTKACVREKPAPIGSTYIFPIADYRYAIAENHILHLNQETVFRSPEKITFVGKDIGGNFWIATEGRGMYKTNLDPSVIRNYPSAYTGKVIVARSIAGQLYFGSTTSDIYRLKPTQTEKIMHCTANKFSMRFSPGQVIINNYGYLTALVYPFIYYDYLSPAQSGLQVFRHRQKIIGDFPYELIANTKTSFETDHSFYFFSVSNIIKINKEDFRSDRPLRTYFVRQDDNDESNRIYAKAIDSETQQVWFCDASGTYRLVDDTPGHISRFPPFRFQQFTALGPYMAGITDNSKLILCNIRDTSYPWDSSRNDQRLWKQVYPIDRQHALLASDREYWLLSLGSPGIAGQPRYTLQPIENAFLPQGAEYIAADTDNCYFFKEGTIIAIKTALLFDKTPPPRLHFITLNTRRHSYSLSRQIEVPYAESRNITIEFDRISYVGNDIFCEYSISQNGKEEWFPINSPEIVLSNPGFGAYTVKIRGRTLSSGYSKVAVLHFKVLKPYWATWWFLTLCALVFLALVWLAILLVSRIKIRRKQRQHDADMKYQQSEYKALNALMNPHFIFNSLNNIQGLINKDEKRTANEYLVIFSDLVRQNMHNVSKGLISLQQELNLVENYLTLEQLRFKELVSYAVEIGEEVDTEDIMIPPLMIQPLVENAVKHGLLPRQSAGGKIWIRVKENDDQLVIEIEDNGVGLNYKPAGNHQLYESFGLSNLQKRTEHLRKIQQHRITIEVKELGPEEGAARGSIAIITIDFRKHNRVAQ